MIVTSNKLRNNVIMLSVAILLIKERFSFVIFKLQMFGFSKLWLEDNSGCLKKTFMGEGVGGEG